MDNFYHKNTEIKSTIKVVQPSIEGRLKNPKRATRSKKLNFAHSFRPIYYVSRFYGLMPFSIVYNSKGKANEPWTGAIDILWFIISICAYISLAFLSYQNMGVPKVPNVPIVLVFADDMILVVGLVYGAVIMAMDMCNRYKLVDILRMFQTIDKEVSSPMTNYFRKLNIEIWYLTSFDNSWRASTFFLIIKMNAGVLGFITFW